MKRRILSLVLALAMVLSLVCVASAEEPTYLEVLELSIAEPVIGQAPPAVTMPEGAPYTVEVYCNEWQTGVEATVLEADGRYHMYGYVHPAAGYTFDWDTVLIVNGEEYPNCHFVDYGNGPEYAFYKDFSFLETIREVEVLAAEPVLGEPVPAATVPEGMPYKVSSTEWIDMESGEPVTVLADGHKYELRVTLEPLEGFEFDPDVRFYFNGEDNIDMSNSGDWQSVSMSKIYSYCQSVDKVEITLPEAVAGSAAPVPTVAEDVPYEVLDFQWNDRNWEQVETLADGQRYTLALSLKPAAGYEFTDETEIYINGEHYSTGSGSMEMWINYAVSFLKTIDTVEISYAEPVIGQAAPEVKIPDGVNYVVDHAYWWESSTGEMAEIIQDKHAYELYTVLAPAEGYEFAEELQILVNGQKLEDGYGSNWEMVEFWKRYSFLEKIDKIELFCDEAEVGKAGPEATVADGAKYEIRGQYWFDSYTGEDAAVLEDLHRYRMYVDIRAAEGYEFAEDAKVYINGEEAGEYWANYTSAEFWQEASFLKKINKVELPAAPADLQVGDSLEIGLGDLGDVNYELNIYWGAVDDELNEAEMGDVAEAGKNYLWMVEAYPAEGYEFADDVEVTMGGKAVDTYLFQIYPEYVFAGKIFTLGELQMIDKVELTVTAPAVGDKEGKLELPADAPYALEGTEWAAGDTDEMDESESGVAVQKGQYVWFGAGLEAKEGYIFSPEVEVYINGEKQDAVLLYDVTAMVVVDGLGQVGVEAAPPTGDAGVALYAVLAVMALCGMAVVLGKKKSVC